MDKWLCLLLIAATVAVPPTSARMQGSVKDEDTAGEEPSALLDGSRS